MNVDANTMAFLLEKRFPASKGWLVAREVRNQTGFASRRQLRSADAIVAQTWPGSGLHLQGFEFKCTLGDFRRELDDLEKSRAFSVHCRSWWIVAPKDVVPIEELVPGWGLLECTERTMRVRVSAAIEKDPEPVPVWMWFSIVRAFAEAKPNPVAVSEEEAGRRKRMADLEAKAIELHGAKRELKDLKERVKEFESAAGIQIGSSWTAKDHSRWFRLAQELDEARGRLKYQLGNLEGSLPPLLEALRAVTEDVESLSGEALQEASA